MQRKEKGYVRREPREPVVLVIGNATVSAWDITEARLSVNAISGHTSMDPNDYDSSHGGRNPVRGHRAQNSTVINVGAVETLLRQAVLASKAWEGQLLPWCQSNAAAGKLLKNHALFGAVQVRSVARGFG